MRRASVPELMDQSSPDPVALAQSLADLAWVNRYCGGTAAVLHQLRQLLRGYDRGTIRVLDVGAGGADILMAMAAWCARRGLELGGAALDLGAETARLAVRALAKNPEGDRMQVVRGDSRQLPFDDGSFDVAYCSTFLHHLDPNDAICTLAEMARVSRWGIVVSDLRRGRSGFLATWLLARTVWRAHDYARHDGPASMRAAYSLREASALARRAGLEAVVEAQPGFRWALRWRR